MISATKKLMTLEREIKMRRRVYPRLIEQGKMSEQNAKDQIAIMEEIADDYRELAKGERLI